MTDSRTRTSKCCSWLAGVGIAVAIAMLPDPVNAADEELVALPLKLPMPAFRGTPTDLPVDPARVEPLSDKSRAPFFAPKGCQNLALNKKVTSSDKSPITGNLELVTDGDKEASDSSFVELHKRSQWVQIDLEKAHKLYAVIIWHAHSTFQVYKGVVVQVADDSDFTQNVRTLFNNDFDNLNGLGLGTDKQYYESFEGKLIPTKGVAARYLRLYSCGSTYSALNRYTEVEAWGLPGE